MSIPLGKDGEFDAATNQAKRAGRTGPRIRGTTVTALVYGHDDASGSSEIEMASIRQRVVLGVGAGQPASHAVRV
jgi:hypothetical protein